MKNSSDFIGPQIPALFAPDYYGGGNEEYAARNAFDRCAELDGQDYEWTDDERASVELWFAQFSVPADRYANAPF